MAVAFAQVSGLSPSPTIRPLVITTLGACLWEWKRPRGWPDITTRVCSSVRTSRYFFRSWYCIPVLAYLSGLTVGHELIRIKGHVMV